MFRWVKFYPLFLKILPIFSLKPLKPKGKKKESFKKIPMMGLIVTDYSRINFGKHCFSAVFQNTKFIKLKAKY
jgi:hypothetical protein